MICPKCSHERQSADTDYPGICPACGIAYIKWQQREEGRHSGEKVSSDPTFASRWQRLYHYTCFMPSDRDESAFWGHSVLYALFLVWGWRFIVNGVDWLFIGGSFLHNPNLAFHEFGHLAFSGFGDFWMLLGGSLFQILLPLFPLAAFMVQQRDNFAASLMLWWCGQNFIDVSPYIADAPTRFIPLTTGNDDSHDWWNLLSMTGSLDLAGVYANLCFTIGALVIILSNVWGAHLLWIEFRGRTRGKVGSE